MHTTWLIVFGWTLLAVPAVQAQFTYTTNSGGASVTITGYTGSSKQVIIPAALNGLLVTDIGTNAFDGSSVTNVTIPDSVTNIGIEAFYDCYDLYDITFGSGVLSIGDRAFSGAVAVWPDYYSAGCSLTSVTLPNSVTSIGNEAFYGCNGLTNITFGDSVASIGEYAFSGWVSYEYTGPGDMPVGVSYASGCPLTKVTFPDSVTLIGEGAFDGCSSLTNITIGSGATNIQANFEASFFGRCDKLIAIDVATNNPAYSSLGGVLFNASQTTLLEYPAAMAATSFTVPDSVTNLEDYAFAACRNLRGVLFQGNAPDADSTVFQGADPIVYYVAGTSGWGATFAGLQTMLWDPAFEVAYNIVGRAISISAYFGAGGAVTIPSEIDGLPVTTVDEDVYYQNSITSITIPESVTDIGAGFFGGCLNLRAINVATNNPFYTSVGGVLFNERQTTLLQYPAQRPGTSYAIPDSVTSIGESAFIGAALTSVTIPNSVTNVGDYEFASCSNLTQVIIGNGVTGIGDNAFEFSGLISCAIPDSVVSIGDFEFFSCSHLSSVTIGSGVTNIGANFFGGCLDLAAINVATNNSDYGSLAGVLFNQSRTTLILYPPAKPGSSYAIPEGVTSIGESAFGGAAVTSVTIPNSVTSIGDYAFASCSNLTNVTIGNRVTQIGNNAFQYCYGLTSVTLGASVTNIGDYAFVDCYDLKAVYAEGNAPSADSNVFFGIAPTVYYLPGTAGWGSTFGGAPTALWTLSRPLLLNSSPGLGPPSNAFGFTVSWATNLTVVVEACTNLDNPRWLPLETNALTSGSFPFNDPQWTNYPGRFYRVRTL